MSLLAKAGDGQFGLDGKRSTEFGARRVEPAEMRQRDDFGPHSRDRARLVMQGAVGPFDRLFEAPRDEMSDSDINGVAKGMPIERALELAQSGRPVFKPLPWQLEGLHAWAARPT